jgi:NAD(P)-dependent dehydrogenase (short-subunit alcohol dehydrogenase family)
MSRPWILVCPSSRGIGHALTRHLLRTTTAPILATARRDPSAVKELLLDGIGNGHDAAQRERLTVVQADVTDEPTVEAASLEAARLFPRETHHLRLGFAIPGMLRAEKSPAQVDAADALMTYRVNALGPLLLMKWFGDFLPRKSTQLLAGDGDGADGPGRGVRMPGHAVWMSMSARVGSTSDNRKGGWYSYRSSKAAVNSLVKTFDHQLVSRCGDKAMALAYHPGTVKTDLSRDFWEGIPDEKLFTPDYAVERMVEVATGKVGLQGRGRCWDWKGEEILP